MAYKKYFVRGKDKSFIEHLVKYQFNPGFALSQKQKNVLAVHEAIQKKYKDKPKKILEVSSKSELELGKKLSAFNLAYKGIPVECWFQSSKCFNNSKINNLALLKVSPIEAKRQANACGLLTGFLFEGHRIGLIPRSLCYDYIYCLAMHNDESINKDELVKFNCFTDIEFMHEKQYNCQARSVCIYTYLYKHGLLEEALKDPESFSYYAY